jgi:Cdc6-like AAA superfamily ATPase
LNSEVFQTWSKTEGSTLFCPGIPGAGKTILTSIVIDYLNKSLRQKDIQEYVNESDNSFGIAYVYCNFRQQKTQTAEDLLLSLLKQFAQGISPLLDCVQNLYNIHEAEQTRPSLEEIGEALNATASWYKTAYIVVDAIDECQSGNCRQMFLKAILDTQSKASANLFVTSRFIPDITKRFSQSASLEIRASEGDIQRYLEGHMKKLDYFDEWSPKLQEEIKTIISNAVDGM